MTLASREDFINSVDKCLTELQNPQDLIFTFPENSGLFRVIPVAPCEYIPAYISHNANRWNQDGEPNQYLAKHLDTCINELGIKLNTPPEALNYVYEYWNANCEIPMLDITKLPEEIQNDLYSRQDISDKWTNSHLFLERFFERHLDLEISGVYAPSASGIVLGYDGICVFTNPEWNHFGLQSTGSLSDLYKL